MWAEGEHDESLEGEELKAPDGQNTDPEDPLGLTRLQEQQPDTAVVRRFLEAVAECRARLNQPMRPLRNINEWTKLKPTILPTFLPKNDNRFDVKSARVFICDGCGNMVRFSSKTRRTAYGRIACDFAGSYKDITWSDIPGVLQRRAWEERVIDATWLCHQVCGAPMTGVNPDARRARTEA